MASVAAIAIGAKGPSDHGQPGDGRRRPRGRARGAPHPGRPCGRRGRRRRGRVPESVYRRLAEMGALSPMRGRGSGRVSSLRPPITTAPVLGEGATFLVLEDQRRRARARRDAFLAEVVASAWGTCRRASTARGRTRVDRDSPVRRGCIRACDAGRASRACYGSGNGDPAVDDWERALLGRDLGAVAPICCRLARSRRSLASTGGWAPCAWPPPRWTPRAGSRRSWCTASRVEAAVSPSWWGRCRERSPHRDCRLQRGGNRRRRRGAGAAARPGAGGR